MAKSKNAAARRAPRKAPSTTAQAPGIDIGLSTAARRKIADGLSGFLADAYTLYLRTHSFHWNVTGPMFNTLHLMFETQYSEQWTALDLVAERIRALGYNAPGSYAEFVKLSSIREEPGLTQAPEWREMVRQLTVGNEAVCRTARKTLKTAEAASDDLRRQEL